MAELTILYNNRAQEGLHPGWGFAAHIRTEGAVVMLDGGADKMVLEHNAEAMACNLDAVTALAISHAHCDHMGAVSSIFHKGLHLYVPPVLAKRYADVEEDGITLTAVKRPTEIVPGVRSIGQLGRRTPEQALLVDGETGPVLITGCAHPGIARMVRRAIELAERPLALVLGGFHLLGMNDNELRRTIDELTRLDIDRIAPCHCTGDDAIAAFRDAYGDRFVAVEAGSRLSI